MTLSQWARDNCKQVTYDHSGCLFVYSTASNKAHGQLWRLEDFKVSSVSGPIVRLIGDYRVKHVNKREDFYNLSFYTLCCISDALHVCSIEGMLSAIQRGNKRGLLTTDTLGNYLVIE